ncbi:hypothetical protein RHMOL_Rhmol03G0263600 [Rhododendron molle]|uniref:Uncharacterized protein n=1 Tax=Rhododendron molle TaxID=49168 RepID=A0ACC0PL26_RHOML|nr:hypothetical protein RHMOL_Rhmol03G0263600 [Rhododendron molle]
MQSEISQLGMAMGPNRGRRVLSPSPIPKPLLRPHSRPDLQRGFVSSLHPRLKRGTENPHGDSGIQS